MSRGGDGDGITIEEKSTAFVREKSGIGRHATNLESQGQFSSRRLNSRRNLASSQIPDEILNDNRLMELMSILPSNYNFEIPKTIWRIKSCNVQRIALQFPEGLLMFACVISDILEEYCFPQLKDIIIIGDITYGACCIDDYTARALNCDFLVHYGHSCLIPIQKNFVSNTDIFYTMYVFVDIAIDVGHFVECLKMTFRDKSTRMALFSTIQFVPSLRKAAQLLNEHYESPVSIAQEKPLSPGEILGCTSPKLPVHTDCCIFVGDGRFHLESSMISNPHVPAYKYNPYSKILTLEKYDTAKMHSIRKNEIKKAQGTKIPSNIRKIKVGIILGTLGRQGSPDVLRRMRSLLDERRIAYVVVLLGEIGTKKLELFDPAIEVWIQIACPRLSIDWGHSFKVPLLNPYEACVLFGNEPWRDVYPMDYYSKHPSHWSVYYAEK